MSYRIEIPVQADIINARKEMMLKYGEKNFNDQYWLSVAYKELAKVNVEMMTLASLENVEDVEMEVTRHRAAQRRQMVHAASVLIAWIEAWDRADSGVAL